MSLKWNKQEFTKQHSGGPGGGSNDNSNYVATQDEILLQQGQKLRLRLLRQKARLTDPKGILL